jgi:hypothetical protein
MALFNECMQSCAHIVLDTADIVRDGDISPFERQPSLGQARHHQHSSGEAPAVSGPPYSLTTVLRVVRADCISTKPA